MARTTVTIELPSTAIQLDNVKAYRKYELQCWENDSYPSAAPKRYPCYGMPVRVLQNPFGGKAEVIITYLYLPKP